MIAYLIAPFSAGIKGFSQLLAGFSLLFAGISLLFATSAAAQELGGTYRGLDGAHGITIQLSRGGDGYVGEIFAPSGNRASLNTQATPTGARGPLTLQGQRGTVELRSQPVGLSMIWRPDNGGTELVYAFRHEQLALPQLPPGYKDPPPFGATRVNPIDFLNSYEFWEAAQVARAYDGLDDKFRVIMKSFATVHTDILWKLCRAPLAPAQLTDALRGQGVTCIDVQQKIKESQKTGAFSNFKRAVHFQKIDALLAVECARGINTASICAQAAQKTQQATLSLETAGSVLQRF
jgi:hypothetical protein